MALNWRVPNNGARPLAAEKRVQGIGLLLIAVMIGLFAGGLLGTQPSVNGYLARHLEHPLQATVISFASGTAIILLITILGGNFPPRFSSPATEMPWWAWFGGAIGVVMVTTSLILVPRVGSLPWFAAVMCGQTVAALVLDHYGWLGNPRTPISSLRLLGAGLLIAGVLVIVQAKRLEHIERTPSETEMEASTGLEDGP